LTYFSNYYKLAFATGGRAMDPEEIYKNLINDRIAFGRILKIPEPEKTEHLNFFKRLLPQIMALLRDMLDKRIDLTVYMECKRRILVYILETLKDDEIEKHAKILFYVPGQEFIANGRNLFRKLALINAVIKNPDGFLASLQKTEQFFFTNNILGFNGPNNKKYADGSLTVGELLATQPNALIRNLYFFKESFNN